MTTAMTTAITTVLCTVLAALIAVPAARRLHPASRPRRGPTDPAQRSSGRVVGYPMLLDAIARQVRSGASLTAAALDEIDRSSALGVVVDRLSAGSQLGEALAAIAPADADLALTVQALSAGAHLGGPVAATLDEAAAVLRERAAARAERRAHSAQARLSARVLTIVPVVFAVWTAISNQRTRDVYVSSIAGATCALSGLFLNFVGWRWMKRIVGPA